MRTDLFTQRVVNLWNSLSQEAVGGQFVRYVQLDMALVAKGIRGYGEKGGVGH